MMQVQIPNSNFHEIWWIASRGDHEWNGVRIAHFRRTIDGTMLVIISGEIDHRRIGPRLWTDITQREGWIKVKQIQLPTKAETDAAFDVALRDVAHQISRDVFGTSGEQR